MDVHLVEDFHFQDGWGETADPLARSRFHCRELESGKILLFRENPFDLPQADRDFLLTRKATNTSVHKNISYRPTQDVLRGFSAADEKERSQMLSIMRRYSRQVTDFFVRFFLPYKDDWAIDYASYRPFEEKNRDLPLHKRNDLLHVDAFPSRPTRGDRILRIFTNMNPAQSRVWQTSDHFEVLAKQFADQAKLNQFATKQNFLERLSGFGSRIGLPLPNRSAYDRFMLSFHDFLKENDQFQRESRKDTNEFPPDCTWVVMTDAVPHAVLSGQFALEQTYIVSLKALVYPEMAPISILEGLCGKALAAERPQPRNAALKYGATS
jgi:3-deoxy-D-manno-oct-2-ulosonic acid (Kdo) hydroxylase